MSNSYYLPEQLVEKIKEEARKQERSESAIVRSAIKKFFEENGKQKNNQP
jgi:predicted transcriptional regulator